MNSRVKIVKRGTVELRQQSQVEGKRESGSSEREIAGTVKGWITDWKQRRELIERSNWNILTKFAQ